MNLAWLDRFMLCEVNYPDAAVEKDLLVKLHPALPEHIVVKMVDFANEIRKQFIGASDSYTDTIEVTLSTRTLLRWADLTLLFQPLAHPVVLRAGSGLGVSGVPAHPRHAA